MVTVLGKSIFVAATFAVTAHAQEGQSIKLGETDLFPSIRLEYIQDSNAFVTEDDATTATAFRIKPKVDWYASRSLLELRFGYTGNYQAASEDALNYNDHLLSANVNSEFTSRKRARAGLNINFGHQEFGRGLTRGLATADGELVEFVDTSANVEYTYGARNARGNITFGLNLDQLSYTSREDVTDGRDSFDIEPFGIFSLRVSGDTRATFELRHKTVDSDSNRDRQDFTLLAGLQFATTGKSGGSFAIGAVQSNYDSDAIDDGSEITVEGELFWEPTAFSRFTLELDRSLDSGLDGLSALNEPTAITDTTKLIWRHSWSSRVSHEASFEVSRINADCPTRGSQNNLLELDATVQVRDWLSFGALASVDSFTNEDCPGEDNRDLDFDKNIVGVYVKATL